MSNLRRLFINSVHCATVTLDVHLACPLPKTVPMSVCTCCFVLKRLLVSQNFTSLSHLPPAGVRGGHDVEVWTPDRRCIYYLLLSASGARADVNNKIHQEIIFVSYFWLPDVADLWILLSFPDLQQHLTNCLIWNISPVVVVYVGWKSCLGFSATNKNQLTYVLEMDIYSSVFKPMVCNSSEVHEDGKTKGVSSGLVLRIVWNIIIDVIRF